MASERGPEGRRARIEAAMLLGRLSGEVGAELADLATLIADDDPEGGSHARDAAGDGAPARGRRGAAGAARSPVPLRPAGAAAAGAAPRRPDGAAGPAPRDP